LEVTSVDDVVEEDEDEDGEGVHEVVHVEADIFTVIPFHSAVGNILLVSFVKEYIVILCF
jgi:hypothetical protein